MNRIQAIAMTFAATAFTATAAPRVAMVRVWDIYSTLQSTEIMKREIKNERDQIMKGQLAVQLRKTLEDLQSIQSKLTDKSNPPDPDTGRNLAQSYEIKRQEAQTLQKEFETFKEWQELEINRKMVSRMRASLDKITEFSGKVAKERGYDIVLDGSGATNTGVAFVLYQKNSPDLTEDVKAALGDAAPPAPAKAPPTPLDTPAKPLNQ